MDSLLAVRPFEPTDVALITDYWLSADETHLRSMGVDPAKLPTRNAFETYLLAQNALPIHQRQSYCLIWLHNRVPVGHSNTRPTSFGVDAYMHLHLWHKMHRGQGWGSALLKLTLPYYFTNLQLATLYCEPFAHNTAPNKTMEKAGFELVKKHTNSPGDFGAIQELMLWEMSREKFELL